MLTDPRPRPRKHLSDMTVVDNRERLAAWQPEQPRVRGIREFASHTP
jgi:hypothetical protein